MSVYLLGTRAKIQISNFQAYCSIKEIPLATASLIKKAEHLGWRQKARKSRNKDSKTNSLASLLRSDGSPRGFTLSSGDDVYILVKIDQLSESPLRFKKKVKDGDLLESFNFCVEKASAALNLTERQKIILLDSFEDFSKRYK